ncbi:alpha/beta hydrolase [Sporolactobacillus pectinivorans]|uniref:alpha/beta hydrolase n=1 Tax=Sporolactobacillus pectinivorans TaxID=1591408 RepID=UPI000C25EE7C|nr:alpha/beta hydrolase [Sporolactobacillus pectinivorans]
METLSMNDYQLHYSFHLSGPKLPTLLFIHGLTMDSSQWSLLIRCLGSQVNTVTYDSYGYGPTKVPYVPVTVERLISEARALIEHLRLDQVHIVGCGMGGNLGFELARRFPSQVASLTMMSSVFFIQKNIFGNRFGLLNQLIDVDRDLMTQKWMTDSFYTLTDRKAALFEEAFQHIPARVIKDKLAVLQQRYDPVSFHFIDELAKISVPTLILHGSNDVILPAQLAAIFSACIPNSRWQIIPDSAQQIPLDQPETSAHLLLKFVTGEKAPLPTFPIHQELTDKYLRILKAGLERSLPDRHLLRINVLRDVTVLWNDEPVDGKWNQRGAKELLLYLVLHHGRASRDELIAAFLPDLPRERARNNLRVRINHLNQIFHNFHDPDVHEILLIGESTVALNSETESDIDDYLARLKAFPEHGFTLKKQAIAFIDLLRQYDPANFSSFRSDWIFSLAEEIDSMLGNVLENLVPKLRAKNMFELAREVLQSARSVEPYDGFCDEQLTEMQHSGVL